MSTRRVFPVTGGLRAIVWLLSDEASYSIGTIIDVSGGRLAPR